MGHQEDLVHLLCRGTRCNLPGVENKVKRSAEFLLQAASKIVPYLPKDLDRSYLLSELNDLAWWYDELARIEKILGIVSDEEARASADNSEGVFIPACADQRGSGSSMASSSTATSTTTRKRPAVDDPLGESRTAKVARPSDLSRNAASLARPKLTSSSLQADDPGQTSAPRTSPEHADASVFGAFEDIRELFADGIELVDELETKIFPEF